LDANWSILFPAACRFGWCPCALTCRSCLHLCLQADAPCRVFTLGKNTDHVEAKEFFAAVIAGSLWKLTNLQFEQLVSLASWPPGQPGSRGARQLESWGAGQCCTTHLRLSLQGCSVCGKCPASPQKCFAF